MQVSGVLPAEVQAQQPTSIVIKLLPQVLCAPLCHMLLPLSLHQAGL